MKGPLRRSRGNHKKVSEAVDLPGSAKKKFCFFFSARAEKGEQVMGGQQKAKGRTDRGRKR